MATFNIKNPNHFMSQIDIDPNTQCWLPRRLEHITNTKAKDRKTTITYQKKYTTWRRLAFRFHFNKEPEGILCANSSCISQNCCNPLHANECKHGNKDLSDEDFLAAIAQALENKAEH